MQNRLVAECLSAARAHDEAQNLGYSYVFPEHILLALLTTPDCASSALFDQHDISVTNFGDLLVQGLPRPGQQQT